MTAPDRTTWTVTEDPRGDQTLWHGDKAVLRKWIDIDAPDEYQDLLWQVLTAVLAPDEATIERLARGARPVLFGPKADDEVGPGTRYERDQTREFIRGFLAALAGTSAQARHTDGDATGGGEHG